MGRDQLLILTGRDAEVVKTYDEISIQNLDEMVEMQTFPKGKGIEDFGNFDEGYCFRLNQIHPITQVYVICASDQETKINFMQYMKKMKCTIQRDQGIVLLPEGPRSANNDPNKPKTISGMLNPKMEAEKKKKAGVPALIDGYWIVLQTWSQCTLKCGGT